MVSFTPNEWVILALVLLLGWVLGLMSRSGGRRWRRDLAAEREAHAATRRDYDARLAEAERRHDTVRHDTALRDNGPRDTIDRDTVHRDTVHRDTVVNRDRAATDAADLRPGERIEIDADGNRVIRPVRP
jgi:hypothetical protein